MLGVARPGIAPLAPGQMDDAPSVDESALPAPPGYEPARELGATIGPGAVADRVMAQVRDKERDRRRRRFVAGPQPPNKAKVDPKAARVDDERGSPRALALVFAAGVLALAAVLVALFWPSPPPLQARARADDKGREGVELVCKSCPDGTKLTIAGTSATIAGGMALLPIPATLSVGENRFKVDIDSPPATAATRW